MNLKQKALKLPQKPGVYLFKRKEEVLYVGKAINLKSRVSSYFQKNILPKTSKMVSKATKIDFLIVESELEALLLEAKLIQKYSPKYNARLKDNKSPIYIKITQESLPKVYLERKRNLKEKDTALGPFNSSYQTRKILKIARRIFPFCTCKKEAGKPCLYTHLGICNPSPREIKNLKGEERQDQILLYRKNIKSLKKFLSGNSKALLEDLEKEMKKLSSREDFEKAALLRDKIALINFSLEPKQKISDYLKNPNLTQDLRQEEIKDLSSFLFKRKLINKPLDKNSRIEGYDISRNKNKDVVGSMVVFKNAEPAKNDYRKFKIRINKSLADSKQMQQVVKRRLNHKDWPYPDLILLDGGKPQLSAIKTVLIESGIDIPVISLAKRKETIFHLKNGFHQKTFKKQKPLLKLLQRVRDESHRFAHTYQDKLKRKVI